MKVLLTMFCCVFIFARAYCQVTAVKSVAFTFNDLDKDIQFFENILHFETIQKFSIGAKASYELFGVKTKETVIADLKLGDESIQLIQFKGVIYTAMCYHTLENDLLKDKIELTLLPNPSLDIVNLNVSS